MKREIQPYQQNSRKITQKRKKDNHCVIAWRMKIKRIIIFKLSFQSKKKKTHKKQSQSPLESFRSAIYLFLSVLFGNTGRRPVGVLLQSRRRPIRLQFLLSQAVRRRETKRCEVNKNEAAAERSRGSQKGERTKLRNTTREKIKKKEYNS